jgi:multiple sugar transport system substrate-binding protein
MVRKSFVSVLSACALSASMLLTGGMSCLASSTEAASSEDAELTLWVYGWEKASADKIREDAVDYEKQTGVHINVVDMSVDSYTTKIMATVAGGENPDLCFMDAGVMTTQLADKGVLLPLNQFGVQDLKGDFYDSVWDTMTWKDDVYGLRITANNLALFYNKELFKKAGIEEPTNDWKWDDLRSAAKALTDDANNIKGLDLPIYNDDGGYTWTWMPFLWQNGGEFLNEDRTEAVFNSTAGVEALEFWKKMVQEDKSVPLEAAPSGVNRFTSGLVAMSIDGPWNLRTFLEDPNFKDKFGVVALPGQKQKATIVGGECVSIFANTKYPQQAYDYLVHLCDSEFTQTFWQNWLTIPPQPQYADFYANDETYGKYIQVFSDQMADSKTRPFTPTWPQISNTMGIDLQSYMFGMSDDAQATLDQAASDVNEILSSE